MIALRESAPDILLRTSDVGYAQVLHALEHDVAFRLSYSPQIPGVRWSYLKGTRIECHEGQCIATHNKGTPVSPQ